MKQKSSTKQEPDFLSGRGEMGERIRTFDWSKTTLGSIETWSESLKTTVGLVLAQRFPMLLWWSKDYICIYNDAYIPILGGKHPGGLGQPVREVWNEIWHVLKPLIDTPFTGGESTWIEDFLLLIARKGFLEETHFTVGYSPVPDEKTPNGIGGVLATVNEITDKIINERALATLRELGAVTFEGKSLDSIYRNVAEALGKNDKDFPFALVYKITDDGKTANVIASTGVHKKENVFPAIIDTTNPTRVTKVFCEAYHKNKVFVSEIRSEDHSLPKGAWDVAPTQFAHLPVSAAGANHPYCIISVALNPFRKFDEVYRQFCQLIADRVSLEINKMLALEEERKKAEALEEIDKAKTVFFSNISHEFRTPLTLLLSPIEELLSGKNNFSEDEKQHLETSHRNALRLLKLVNTLLDFSRIESGKQQAQFVLTDIVTLTKNLAGNFRSLIEKAGLKFTIKTDSISQPVYLDRQMWEKIVFNLLSNAYKYTLKGAISVELKAERGKYGSMEDWKSGGGDEGGFVVLKVKDSGVGIPEEELPKMFERFHRARNVVGRTYEGTGIGLSFIKELVQMHGGIISVESKRDKGSVFSVKIPMGKEHIPFEQIVPEEKYQEQGSASFLIDEADVLFSKNDRENKSVTGKKQNRDLPTVLVADDNTDMREHLRSVLSGHFNVVTADNGMDALYKIDQLNPELVVSDIMMPVLDGVGLLKKMKSNKNTAQIPVIFLTARAGEESRIEGWETGADDYLVKPFSSKELIARIRSQIETKRIRNDVHRILEQKVNERTVQLVKANDDLEKMNKELESFTYVASHDLQEPLRKIQTFAGRIITNEKDHLSETGKEYFSRMSDAAIRMQTLIQDLLAFSRVNTAERKFEPTSLNKIIEEIKEEFSEVIKEKKAIIDVGELCEIKIIPFQFRQLFHNLIGNSLKFINPEVSPCININSYIITGDPFKNKKLLPGIKYCHITFTDNGIGFEPEFSEKIFEMFQKLHGKEEYTGTGIGLAIVKKIVEVHHGVITASGEMGKGARFDIFIPA